MLFHLTQCSNMVLFILYKNKFYYRRFSVIMKKQLDSETVCEAELLHARDAVSQHFHVTLLISVLERGVLLVDRPTNSPYLSCGPRLVLRTAVHCNRLVHVLVHLKQTNRDSCYDSEAHGWEVKSPRCFDFKQFSSVHTRSYCINRQNVENTQRSGPLLLRASTCTASTASQRSSSKSVGCMINTQKKRAELFECSYFLIHQTCYNPMRMEMEPHYKGGVLRGTAFSELVQPTTLINYSRDDIISADRFCCTCTWTHFNL